MLVRENIHRKCTSQRRKKSVHQQWDSKSRENTILKYKKKGKRRSEIREKKQLFISWEFYFYYRWLQDLVII